MNNIEKITKNKYLSMKKYLEEHYCSHSILLLENNEEQLIINNHDKMYKCTDCGKYFSIIQQKSKYKNIKKY